MDNSYQERDLKIIAFLLACDDIEFVGHVLRGSSVYCQFKPYDKASLLASQFLANKAPTIQPKRLFDALTSARSIIFKAKDEAGIGR